jgi:(S)-ureidoglycine aminohydrolase
MTPRNRSSWFGTRGATRRSFHLLTPDNRYPSRLAGLADATVCKLITPRRIPSQFGQYVVEIEPGGGTRTALAPGFEHFVYVLAGSAVTMVESALEPLASGGFAYVPDGQPFVLRNESAEPGSVLWIKRRYEPVDGLERPLAYSGDRHEVPEVEIAPGFLRRELGPADDPRHDFAVSILRFAPSAGLTMVEIHEEEHGLYMTAGSGVYLLEGGAYHVERDDFIYMAPYCPQSFRADPNDGAEYLLYKGTFRDGF